MQELNINIGLHKDDGLAITNISPREVEKTKKSYASLLRKISKNHNGSQYKKVVDFPDITFNLRTGA